MRNKLLALGGLAAAMLVVSPAANATLLCLAPFAPGATLPTVNTNGTCLPGAGSSIVANTGLQPYLGKKGTPVTVGDIAEQVVKEASGTLDFFIEFSVTGTGPTSGVLDLSTTGFSLAGLTANIGSIDPSKLNLFGVGSNVPVMDSWLGSTIDWNFPGQAVKPGKESFVLAISTNATAFASCNSCIAVNTTDLGKAAVGGFVPTSVSAVPEPVSIILLGTTLALSAVFIRRRHASKTSLKV